MKGLLHRAKHKLLAVLSVIVTLAVMGTSGTVVFADYIYDSTGLALAATPAYTLRRSVTAADLGFDTLPGLTSLFVRDGKVYIADKNRIVITDTEFNIEKVITEYEYDGTTAPVTDPSGLFVTTTGQLYICQPMTSQIFQLDKDYNVVRVLGKPDVLGLEGVEYRPYKIVLDEVDRMYVVAKNVYEGIMELNPDGTFSRFFGVNSVKFNPISVFWRSIATEAQRAQMQLWLPTDFNSVAIDHDGFIYSTSKGTDNVETLKKMNAQGKDILRFQDDYRPMGDYNYLLSSTDGTPVGPSILTAVDCNNYGMYTVLDSNRSRVFTYNEDGELLYIFGGPGTMDGKLQTPTDLKFMGSDILVADQQAQRIDVFSPTIYGTAINNAVVAQFENRYDDAAQYWQSASNINPNFELAYTGIGKSVMRKGEYEKAAELFKKGQNRAYYSKAFEKVRADWIDRNFNTISIALIALVVLLVSWNIYKYVRNKRRGGPTWDE